MRFSAVTTVAGSNCGYGTYSISAVKAYSTVAISRDLTSGAALSATYSSLKMIHLHLRLLLHSKFV